MLSCNEGESHFHNGRLEMDFGWNEIFNVPAAPFHTVNLSNVLPNEKFYRLFLFKVSNLATPQNIFKAKSLENRKTYSIWVCIWSSILTTVTFSTITTQPPTHRPSMSTPIYQLITSSPHPPPNRSRAHKYKFSVGWESILVCQSHISGVSSFTSKVLS